MNLNRRHFLQAAAATAATTSITVSVRAADVTRAVGIQLYTMQAPLVQDFAGTLQALGRIGYQEVETVGLLGHDARQFRRALDSAGLVVPSAHVLSLKAQQFFIAMATGKLSSNEAWAKINAEMDISRITSILDDMFVQSEVLGNKYLVLAALDATLLTTREGIDKVIEAFTKAGDLCHARGQKFAFHPHLAEFARVDGVSAADRILKATHPDRVFVELDFFWAAAAGVDIPAWLADHSGRVHLGHVKDMAKGLSVPVGGYKELDDLKGDPFEDVGYGQFDYHAWIPLARKAGMRHFFVERDNAPEPLVNAARSFPNVQALLTLNTS
jgi:sugar phosphate isomerase/epimerase